ncbi:MAG: hypothetical protein PHF18_03025 [Methanosarcina sp.]|uniref:hypothetical protein n=1 Tax=Methanosarcina sp. TaxID=2213 RepID=UPI00261712C0|nr:hypothetical protein [Methanosarcina sp.]MDD3245827.1 hypothetical protein [Methanosarcina sp.]
MNGSCKLFIGYRLIQITKPGFSIPIMKKSGGNQYYLPGLFDPSPKTKAEKWPGFRL